MQGKDRRVELEASKPETARQAQQQQAAAQQRSTTACAAFAGDAMPTAGALLLVALAGGAAGLAGPAGPRRPLLGADVREFAADEASWDARVAALAALPAGFSCATAALEFVPRETPGGAAAAMNLGVVALDAPTDAVAGVLTRNRLCGAPVSLARRLLAKSAPRLQAIVVNNKVSNVRPGPGLGEPCAEAVAAAVATALGLEGTVASASTGVIGWALPVPEMVAAAPALALARGDAAAVARAMMTTDRYAKAARADLPGGGSVVGVVKGAGMIEPNLGTMLCFVLTDARVAGGRGAMQAALERAAADSLGSVGVDGDESTSDMVLVASSEAGPPCDDATFEAALGDVLGQLAHHVVRNGEGTNHVLRVTVRGDATVEAARALGRGVVNGPLLKCAVAGDDPNVGRVVAKVGQLLGARGDAALLDEGSPCRVALGGETIFERGQFALDAAKEGRLAAHMRAARLGADDPDAPRCPPHGRCVEIDVDLGGDAAVVAVVLGSDLTHEYVTENADYRS